MLRVPMRVPTRLAGGLLLAGALTLVSGCGADATPGAAASDAGTSTFKVAGTDQLKFDPSSATVPAGTVTITLTAGKAVNHDVVIEQVGTDPVVAAGAGQTKSGSVKLDPGTYTFYCNVPGHRQAGMEGTLTVT